MPTVSDLLEFERRHEKHTSRKEVLILDELGIKPARYYQLLRHALRSVETWEMDPMLCDRILRRSARAA
jgi:Protein of unknown function (DUF3263).